MKERSSNDPLKTLIDDANQTVDNLMRLRNEYRDELWDTYLRDIDDAIGLIELFRGILDGTIV